jgi:hypothetical protein
VLVDGGGGASLMFSQEGGGLPFAFIDGRWWILVLVAVGSGCLSTVALDLHGWKGVSIDGSGGDLSPRPRAIDGVHWRWICFVEGVAG